MEVIVVLVDVEDSEDVRVWGEEGDGLGFVVEALAVDGVVGDEAFVDGFDGEGGAGGVRVAAENDAESSPADLFANGVVSVECVGH